MIPLKSEKELEMLRQAGKILSRIMQNLKDYIKPGITTALLNSTAEELMYKEGVVSAFKGYRGFPASICASINEEIVHGIPGERTIEEGDIISLDVGINYQGFFSDTAATYPVGKIDKNKRKLIEVTKTALLEGVKQARQENHLYDISCSVQNYVEKNGFSVVRQFVGHGIGLKLHEEPEVPNFGRAHEGPLLKSGMVLAIEPMVNEGGWESEILENGWTAVTKDRLASAHFEHTVVIGEKGPEILTG